MKGGVGFPAYSLSPAIDSTPPGYKYRRSKVPTRVLCLPTYADPTTAATRRPTSVISRNSDQIARSPAKRVAISPALGANWNMLKPPYRNSGAERCIAVYNLQQTNN